MANMERAEIRRRIAELKAANVPPLDWRDILTEKPDAPLSDADREALTAYFSRFMVTPQNDDGKAICPCCRRVQRSGIEGALLGGSPGSATLAWSLAHGEAHCSACGWPYRVYHYDIGGKGEDAIISRLNVALAVHPSGIDVREDEAARESAS